MPNDVRDEEEEEYVKYVIPPGEVMRKMANVKPPYGKHSYRNEGDSAAKYKK